MTKGRECSIRHGTGVRIPALLFIIVMMFAMMFTMMPLKVNAGQISTETVKYVDADGQEQEQAGVIPLVDYSGEDAMSLGESDAQSWYVVSENGANVSAVITVSGDVNLILADGATLTASKGFTNSSDEEEDTSLTIYGQTAGTGKLEVKGGYSGDTGLSGIGVKNITINGGKVSANGGDAIGENQNGAGISAGGKVEINGGIVEATAGNGEQGYPASGIEAGGVTITGGTVTAVGGVMGIETYYDSSGVTINGGTVTATGGEQGIGGTVKNSIAGTGWTNTEGTEGKAAIEISTDEGQDLSDYKRVQFLAPTPVSYVYYKVEDGKAKKYTDGTCDTYTTVTQDTTSWTDGEWYVVDSNVTISNRITVSGTVNLILCDGATLTASKGITVIGDNTLNIYAQSEGTGKLYAGTDADGTLSVESYFAGIGGGYCDSGGTVNISGGTVTAIGSEDTAGIGGGYYASGGTVNISGGTVTATGSGGAAGIGGGDHGAGGTVAISGDAKVTANGSVHYYKDYNGEYIWTGAGIGGGGTCAGGTVTISDNATVTAIGGASGDVIAMGIGAGSGSTENGSLTVADGLEVRGGDDESSAIVRNDYNTNRYTYMKVQEAPHTHSFTYSASGDTITATCGADGCTLPPSAEGEEDHVATLTIAAPEHKTYEDGEETAAAITDANNIQGDALVKYYKATKSDSSYAKGDELTDAPTDAGDYVAEITLGTGTNTATASVGYTIAKAAAPESLTTAQKPTEIENLAYTGSAQALVTAPSESLTGYTVKYSTDNGSNWSTDIPTGNDAGTYTVKVKYAGDDNHTDFEGTDISVTIAKAAAPAESTLTAAQKPTGQSGLVYTESAQALVTAPSESLTGYTVKYSTDNGSNWSTDIPTGTNVGTYTVKVKYAGDDNHTDFEGTDISVKIAEVDKTDLKNAISEAETFCDSIKGESKYDEISASLEEVIGTAEEYDEDKNVTATKVASMVTSLNAAKTSAEAVKVAIDLIEALPASDNIATTDKEAIEAARAAYDALTADQKAKVSADTLTKLTAAETALAAAEKEAADASAAKNVADLIDALPASGKITTTDKSAIEAARAAYDALTADQKAKVSADTLTKLTAAETALAAAEKEAADASAAKNVADIIDALTASGKITTTDKSAIEAARAAYNALTDEQKAKVSAATLKKLTDAEAALAAAVKAEAASKTKNVKNGDVIIVNKSTYTITSVANGTVKFTNAKNVKKVTIPATVTYNGKKYAVTGIAAKAFKGKKTKTIVIKTKKLTKKSVKKSLKGSKVKKIKVKVGKKKVNRKYVKKYKKIFKKKNSGKIVKVK